MPGNMLSVKGTGFKQLDKGMTKIVSRGTVAEQHASSKTGEKNNQKNIDIFPFLQMLHDELQELTSKDNGAAVPMVIPDGAAQIAHDAASDDDINSNLPHETTGNKKIFKKDRQFFEGGKDKKNTQYASTSSYVIVSNTINQYTPGLSSSRNVDKSLISLHDLLQSIEKHAVSYSTAVDRPQTMGNILGDFLKDKGYSDDAIGAILEDKDIKQLSLSTGENVSALVKKIKEIVAPDIKNNREVIQELPPDQQVSINSITNKLPLADDASFLQREGLKAEPRGMDKYAAKGENESVIVKKIKEIIAPDIKNNREVIQELPPDQQVNINGITNKLPLADDASFLQREGLKAEPRRVDKSAANEILLSDSAALVSLHDLLQSIEKHTGTYSIAIDRPQTMGKIIEDVLKDKGYSDDAIGAILEDKDIKQLSLLTGENVSAIVRKIKEMVAPEIKNNREIIKALPSEQQVSIHGIPNKLSLADDSSLVQREGLEAEPKGFEKTVAKGILLSDSAALVSLHDLLQSIEKHTGTYSIAIDRPQTMGKIIEDVLKDKGYSDDAIGAILEDKDIKQLSLLTGENVSAIVKKIKEMVAPDIKNNREVIKALPSEQQVSIHGIPNKLPLADDDSLVQSGGLKVEPRVADKSAAKGKYWSDRESSNGDTQERISATLEPNVTANKREFPTLSPDIQGHEEPFSKNVKVEPGVIKSGAYFPMREDKQKDTVMPIQKEMPAMNELFSSTGRADLALPTDGKSIMQEQKIAFVRTNAFIERIADLLPQVAYSGSGRLKIVVTPPNLGSIDMAITVRENTVQVVMRAEHHDVQQMLQGNVDQLKGALQQQGLQVDSFDVLLQSGRYGLPGEAGGRNAYWRDVQQERQDKNGLKDAISPTESFLSRSGKNLIEAREGISIFA